jgi:hypothetical protein
LDTLGGIIATLGQRGVFAVTVDPNMKTAVKSEDLADVTAQDIKTSPYLVVMDKTRLMTDEMNWAKAWMNANLTGIGGVHSATLTWAVESGVDSYNAYRSATSGGPYTQIANGLSSPSYVDYAVNPQQVWYYVVTGVSGGVESGYSNEVSATIPGNWVYVYPGSYEDTSTEAIAVSAGFAGSRGSGTMQPSPNAATVMASGVNIENILSQGMVPYFQGLTDQQFVNKFRAIVFKSGVWGVPIGIFWHWNELTPSQVSMMLDTLKSSGATIMTNTQLVNYLLGTQQNFGTTYFADSNSGRDIDVRPTQISPVVDRGAALASEYKFDLMGIDQTLFGAGWEMGSFVMVPEYLGQVR